MEIVKYGNNHTRKLCSDSKKAKKDLGELVAEKLFAAINFIESASSLNDVACVPTYHLHQLSGDKEDLFSMDLGRKLGFRLIIKPDPPLTQEEDKLDFNSKCSVVKCIIVLEVSNHYE
jgi:toxin HigB-1